MISTAKFHEYFQPEKVSSRIHILGCGAVGATIAENLARFDLTKMTLWDFDKVEEKNVHNQIFRANDVGHPKVEALANLLCEINPEIERDLVIKPNGWNGEKLSGYVFLAVDNIDLRRTIVEKHMNDIGIRAMFDVRNGLTETQLYFADWSDYSSKEAFLSSMQFSHDEVGENERVSACGTTLGVVTTSRIAAGFTASNFVNHIRGKKIAGTMLISIENPSVVAF